MNDITNTRDYLVTFGETIIDNKVKRRSIDINKIGKYGISILDSYLGGILDNELVVIGAGTGFGKSDVAYSIAIENARKKKVLLFALEGDINEIASRYTQKEIYKIQEVRTIDYRFNLDPSINEIESIAIDNMEDSIKENLFIYNKKQIPTLKFLKEMITICSEGVDMIIIDHLHYIQTETENENREIGEIMRELKTLTDIINKPIILISHLRKINNDTDPEINDLYGSSNVGKEATTVILINRLDISKFEGIMPNEYLTNKRYCGTKFLIKKSRIGLPLSNFQLIYDRVKKEYIYGELITGESRATKEDILFKY